MACTLNIYDRNSKYFEETNSALKALNPTMDGVPIYDIERLRTFLYGTSYAEHKEIRDLFFEENALDKEKPFLLLLSNLNELELVKKLQEKPEELATVLENFQDFIEHKQVGERYSTKNNKYDTLYEFLYGFYNPLESNQAAINGSVIGSGAMNVAFKTTADGKQIIVKELSNSLRQRLNQGMTTILFDIIAPQDLLDLVARKGEYKTTLNLTYGSPSSSELSVFTETVAYLTRRYNQLLTRQDNAKEGSPQFEQLERALQDLELLLGMDDDFNFVLEDGVLAKKWQDIKKDHATYLRKLDIDASLAYEDQTSDDAQKDTGEINSRDSLGITPANQVNPVSRLNKQLKVILKTLPQVEKHLSASTNEYVFKMNTMGLPDGANFGKVLRTLYTALAGKPDVASMFNALSDLALKDYTYAILIERLGISSEGWGDTDIKSLSENQVEMLVSFITTFNNANHTYTINNVASTGQRNTQNANMEGANRIKKSEWRQNFKALAQGPRGIIDTDVNKYVLNLEAKVQGRTVKDRLNYVGSSSKEMIENLALLGIVFTDPDSMETLADLEFESFSDAVKNIFKDVVEQEGNISDVFELDLGGRFNTLLEMDNDSTINAGTLQLRGIDNSTIYAISLKGFNDLMADSINEGSELASSLQDSPTAVNSIILNNNETLEISTMLGTVNTDDNRGIGVTNTGLGDTAVQEISSILDGRVPMIKSGNKTTHTALRIGKGSPSYNTTEKEYIERLVGYLEDEIVTAQMITHGAGKQIKGLTKRGSSLQFFNHADFADIKSIAEGLINSSKTTRGDVQKSLETYKALIQTTFKAHIKEQKRKVKETLLEFNVISKSGKVLSNIGIDSNQLEMLERNSLNGKLTGDVINDALFDKLAEQIVFIRDTSLHEQFKIFLGHPAVFTDLFKRTSLFIGPKKYPITDGKILDWAEQAYPNLGNPARYANVRSTSEVRYITRKEVTEVSKYKNEYVEVLKALQKKNNLSKETYLAPILDIVEKTYGGEGVVGKYTHQDGGMEVNDGGGFIHIDFYRRVRLLTDSWDEKAEKAYQNVISGNAAETDLGVLAPLKPQVVAQALEDGIDIRIGNKFALFPIHPNMTKVVGTESGQSVADSIYADMNKNNLDYMVMESASKVSPKMNSRLRFDDYIDENENYKPLEDDSAVQVYSLDFFGVQMDPKDKRGKKVSVGTQILSSLLTNIFNNAEINPRYEGNFKPGETWTQAAERYHKLNGDLVQREAQQLAAKLGFLYDKDAVASEKENKFVSIDPSITRESMRDTILDELDRREVPANMRNSIWNIFEGDNNLLNQIAEKSRLEIIINSIITNSIVQRKMNGDMVVLQSNFGLTVENKAVKQKNASEAIKGLRRLEFYRKDSKAGVALVDQDTLAMEVYMPHSMREFFGKEIPEYIELTEEVKEAIGFRIPTEGLNSVEFIKIVDFLPKEYGSTIIVPSEMVAKSGADFDIDKLTLYLPNTEIIENKVQLAREVKGLSTMDFEYLATADVNAFKVLAYDLLPTTAAKKIIKQLDKIKNDTAIINGLFKAFKDHPVLKAKQASIDDLKAERLAASDIETKRELKKLERDLIKEMQEQLFTMNDNDLFDGQEFDKVKLKQFRAKSKDDILSIAKRVSNAYMRLSPEEKANKYSLLQTRQYQENQMQIFMRDVLRHPESFDQLITPVGAFGFKEIAYEISQRVTGERNWVKDEVTKEYTGEQVQKELYDKLSLKNLIETTNSFYQTLGGTGIVATTATHNTKMQKYNVKFSADRATINFEKYHKKLNIGNVYSFGSDRAINAEMQQYITAYVDGEKDPFAVFVNAGKNGAAVHMLLLRLGVPLRETLFFMSQPIITDFLRMKSIYQSQSAATSDQYLSNDDIVEDLNSKKYKTTLPSENTKFSLEDLDLMLDKDTFSDQENAYQQQILNDYLHYKELAEDLRNLVTIHSYDKMTIKNGSENIWLEALEMYVENNEAFEGAMVPIEDPGSMLSYSRDAIMASTELLSEIDLKNSNKNIRDFYTSKALEMIQLGKSKDEIVYTLNKYDNFVSISQIHNVVVNDSSIASRVSGLFQGPNSVPKRIKALQESDEISNLALDNFLPLLDVYIKGSANATVDGLRLREGKYDTYDIDMLSESFEEIKRLQPDLHQDIILYSLLQSGVDFNPNAFYSLISPEDMLSITDDAFTGIRNLDNPHRILEGLWNNFMSANHDNGRVVAQRFVGQKNAGLLGAMAKGTLSEKMLSNLKGNEVTLTKKVGSEYISIFFKRQAPGSKWRQADKKGIKNMLIETSNMQSIIVRNQFPDIAGALSVTNKVANMIINEEKTMYAGPKKDIGSYVLDNQAIVNIVDKGYYGTAKTVLAAIKKNTDEEMTAAELAEAFGYSTLKAAKASPKYSKFFANNVKKGKMYVYDLNVVTLPDSEIFFNEEEGVENPESVLTREEGINESECNS